MHERAFNVGIIVRTLYMFYYYLNEHADAIFKLQYRSFFDRKPPARHDVDVTVDVVALVACRAKETVESATQRRPAVKLDLDGRLVGGHEVFEDAVVLECRVIRDARQVVAVRLVEDSRQDVVVVGRAPPLRRRRQCGALIQQVGRDLVARLRVEQGVALEYDVGR